MQRLDIKIISMGMLASMLVFLPSILKSQSGIKTFGNEGWTFNGGCSILGPIVSITNGNSPSGEFYFGYQSFDWEKNENLINKPTSGGFQFGWNFFVKYYSSSRIKWLYGIGGGTMEERVGKTSFYRDKDWTGTWIYYEAHGGLRFFITQKVSVTGWLGYLFKIDDSNSILKQHKVTDLKETMSPVGIMLHVSYTF